VLIATNELGSPVEIVEKPKPSYTEEGRKHGVEGEVRLEVQFTADGHVRVLRVLQRLGFGLDEQALHCAEHIRFKPATHGGRPIDSTAVVHIVFELAS
jgi:TonB family protein